MVVGVVMGHPAHFHYFKYAIHSLRSKNIEVHIAINKKDILEDLLINEGFDYTVIRGKRSNGFLGLLKSLIVTEIKLLSFIRRKKIQLLIGITFSFFARRVAGIDVIVFNEDDADVVPKFVKLTYPNANYVMSPVVCNNGKWEYKSIKYHGYQKLAYLHPNQFTPQKEIVEQYFKLDKPYFLIRFAQLTAHHDHNIKGIDTEIARKIIEILKPHGKIFITSERALEPEFESYRLNINPLDIHHVMAFATLFVGDSQSMSAESGLLGVPFVRFNDFVGRIGYLNELEHVYELGYGIKTDNTEKLLSTISNIIHMKDRTEKFASNRKNMLRDKIDVTAFYVWFVENYPESVCVMKNNPEYQYRFK